MPVSFRADRLSWRKRRVVLFGGGVCLMLWGVAVFPLRLLPWFWVSDTVLHFIFGAGLTLVAAALVRGRDDVLACCMITLGIVWEPVECWYFYCDTVDHADGLVPRLVVAAGGEFGFGVNRCTANGFARWMMGDNTVKDMGYVALGSVVALVGTGRYE